MLFRGARRLRALHRSKPAKMNASEAHAHPPSLALSSPSQVFVELFNPVSVLRTLIRLPPLLSLSLETLRRCDVMIRQESCLVSSKFFLLLFFLCLSRYSWERVIPIIMLICVLFASRPENQLLVLFTLLNYTRSPGNIIFGHN